MPRQFSTAEIAAALNALGFVTIRQRGSHLRYMGTLHGIRRNVTLVARQDPIPPATIRSIRSQVGLSRRELEYLVDHGELPPEDPGR